MTLAPQATVSPDEQERGLSILIVEGGYASATGAVTSGVILTAFGLHLGASNLMIGLLAAAPFLSQLLQAPAILLVERLRRRKAIAVISSVIGRSMLALMALLAFASGPGALAGLLIAQLILCAMSAFGSCAWNAWIRDLAPDARLGDIFARRTIYVTAVAVVAGLAAAFALDQTAEGTAGRNTAFALLYAAGCVAGMLSARLVAKMPEPRMPVPRDGPPRLIPLLREPLRDANFSRLIVFLSSWQFAVNFATPFFTVYLVRQLGYSMTFVVALSVISQVANVAALRSWGSLVDRFTNKSALLVAAPAYILCIVAMAGASQIEREGLASAYLVLLHILMGAAVAGVTLATTNIALKLSPRGSATAYVATNALVTSFAAGIAPILGGALADWFGARRLELSIRWMSPDGVATFLPLSLSQWDFYFVIAGIIGVYALHRLGLVREEGEIDRRQMVQHVIQESRETVRNLSTVAGLRAVTQFPLAIVREARVRARWARTRLP